MVVSPWYVWLVGKYTEENPDALLIVGIFTSLDKARKAAYQGCWISVVPVDEVGQVQLEAEWVE